MLSRTFLQPKVKEHRFENIIASTPVSKTLGNFHLMCYFYFPLIWYIYKLSRIIRNKKISDCSNQIMCLQLKSRKNGGKLWIGHVWHMQPFIFYPNSISGQQLNRHGFWWLSKIPISRGESTVANNLCTVLRNCCLRVLPIILMTLSNRPEEHIVPVYRGSKYTVGNVICTPNVRYHLVVL